MPVSSRLSSGVHLQSDGRARVPVWAPAWRTVDVIRLGAGADSSCPLTRDGGGFFSAVVPSVGAGDRYWLRLDDQRLRPDPASRFQPDGPHGPSMVADPSAESVAYGGQGTPQMDLQGEWRLPGESAVILADEHDDAE